MEIMPNSKNLFSGYLLLLIVIVIVSYNLSSPMPFTKTVEIFFYFLVIALISSFFIFLEFKSLNGVKFTNDKLLVIKAYDNKIIQEIQLSDVQRVEIKQPSLTSNSWFIRIYRQSSKNTIEVNLRNYYMSRTKANQFIDEFEKNSFPFPLEVKDVMNKTVKRF